VRVGVLGLWHLGSVTAACLAEGGVDVVAVDPDASVVAELRSGRPPVAEPGLEELIERGQSSGRLRFLRLDESPFRQVDSVWITFDTPVDAEDGSDSDWVIEQSRQGLRDVPAKTLIIVSSQLPVGSTARLAGLLSAEGRDDLRFACVPENLRLGDALSSFRSPDRIVAGVRHDDDRGQLMGVLSPFTDHIEWMSVESAEMTKHALNGFLAVSVTFINEIASLCECVGADASEVSRGLKSDVRIGQRSYLSPGDVFAGGTLARDISTLNQLARTHELPGYLISGTAASNDAHRQWASRALVELVGTEERLQGKRVAVWGLTYKPGTDTLRRSSAIELCHWLHDRSVSVRAHDPALTFLPASEAGIIELCATPLSAAFQADALVVCTPWPQYREVRLSELIGTMRVPIVVDAAGHVQTNLGSSAAVRYARVGTRPR
jgi:UDPglucose 6-dehydrogenase